MLNECRGNTGEIKLSKWTVEAIDYLPQEAVELSSMEGGS